MSRRCLALLAVTMGLSAPAMAAPTKAELMQKAAEGAAICAQTLPDRRATDAALKAQGFRLFDTNGVVKAYTANGNRVVIGITTAANSMRADGCLAVVSKMTLPEAETLIQPWLNLSGAVPTKGAVGYERSWRGSFKGGPVDLAIEENLNLGIVRGAAIIARSSAR